jgi:hypothetical protein
MNDRGVMRLDLRDDVYFSVVLEVNEHGVGQTQPRVYSHCVSVHMLDRICKTLS